MKTYRYLNFLPSLLLFGYAWALQGQGATISGKVSNVSGVPLDFATIVLDELGTGINSEQDGTFLLDEIPPGTYTLKVTFLGHLSQSTQVSLRSGQNLVRDFYLQEDALNLEGVVVSGTRYEQDRVNNPVVVGVIDHKLFNATQSIAITEGLHFQPGVRVETNCQNCGFTQVRLNGLEGAYSQILINSRPIFSSLNSVYGLDQIPTNIVERLEVVRGGGSALYGSNAIAGTINIITKDPDENTWEIRSNTALIEGDALDQTFHLNGSIVNESLTSGITFYGMNRHRDSYDANGDGFTELVQLENTVFGAKAFYKPGATSKITVDFSALEEYRRGGDRLELAPHFTDITEELDHNTLLGGLTFDQWTRNNKNKFSAYISAQYTQRDSYYGGLGGGSSRQDSLLAVNAYGITEDLALVGGVQYTRYFDDNGVLAAGVENQINDTNDEIPGYRRHIDQQVNTTGFFAQYEWNPNHKWTALIGGRYDVSSVEGLYSIGAIRRNADVNIGVFSPRATILYKVNDHFRLRGGYARGFRSPQAFNEDLHISSVGGEPLFVILSDELEKETSDALTASLNYTKNSRSSQINFLVEGFYTQLKNPFTTVSLGAVLPNGSILEEVQNGEGADVTGMNFEAGYSSSGQWAFQMGGTVQKTSYREVQEIFAPEDNDGKAITVDEFVRNPNVYGYFTSYYDVNDALRIDLTGTFTGSMMVPRIVGADGTPELLDSDPFLDINLKASYHFNLAKDLNLELSGGVRNVLNSYQPEFDSGPQRDSDFIYGPMAPRTVFLSVKVGNFN